MSNHTPGPWKAKKWCEVSWVINSEKIGVAQTVGGNDEANAHLIAAAPEMLKALKLILGKKDPWDRGNIRRLIKKAEGKEVEG